MPDPKKPERCPSCGGSEFVNAVDNDGNPYLGCATCFLGQLPKTWFVGQLTSLTEAASAGGVPDTTQVFDLFFIALAILDRNTQGGCSLKTFERTAAIVYDKCRAALSAGPSN